MHASVHAHPSDREMRVARPALNVGYDGLLIHIAKANLQ